MSFRLVIEVGDDDKLRWDAVASEANTVQVWAVHKACGMVITATAPIANAFIESAEQKAVAAAIARRRAPKGWEPVGEVVVDGEGACAREFRRVADGVVRAAPVAPDGSVTRETHEALAPA